MFGLSRLWGAINRLTSNLERLADLSAAVVGEVEGRMSSNPVPVPQLQDASEPPPGNGETEVPTPARRTRQKASQTV